MSEMSVVDAAAELGVSGREVTRLVHAGDLAVARSLGGMLLLEAGSVHRRAQMRRHRGRPWSEGVAWAALALLSGERVGWISPAQTTRLGHRLRRSSAEEVAFLARRRAVVHRMQGWLDGARSQELTGHLVVTAASALGQGDIGSRFGLAPHRRDIDGYGLAEDFDGVVANCGLVAEEGSGGNVTVRAVTVPDAFATGRTPVAAVAVDLTDSLDTRERSAGLRVLQELLDAFG